MKINNQIKLFWSFKIPCYLSLTTCNNQPLHFIISFKYHSNYSPWSNSYWHITTKGFQFHILSFLKKESKKWNKYWVALNICRIVICLIFLFYIIMESRMFRLVQFLLALISFSLLVGWSFSMIVNCLPVWRLWITTICKCID